MMQWLSSWGTFLHPWRQSHVGVVAPGLLTSYALFAVEDSKISRYDEVIAETHKLA